MSAAESTTTIKRTEHPGWTIPGRPTRAMVDLDAIAENVRFFRRLVTPGTAVMAVVKADGYGHGAVMVAREALAAGAAQLAVATVDEGIVLRSGGISAPVLVLGPIDPSEVEPAVRSDLTLTLVDERFARLVGRMAHQIKRPGPVPVHVKVDTGLARFGTTPGAAVSLCRAVAAEATLSLAGLYTHFADADSEDEAFTSEQARRFDECRAAAEDAGVRPLVVHASNSAATLRWRRYDYGMVRVGIALYGLPPASSLALPSGLRPALEVRSRLGRTFAVAAGETVSYGRTYRATAPERLGLLPIGYADGYRRELSNRGYVGIDGRRAPVRGRVCMDQTVVGIPDGVDATAGHEVIVFGAALGGGPSIAAAAEMLGTISYEIATGLARRVPRVYVRGGCVVALQDLHGVRLFPE